MLALALPLLLAQAVDEDAVLAERAALCGSEVNWAADWQEAASRAKQERKLILVAFQNYPGFELGDLPSIGPFMDPDIIALTNARFVPLRFRLGMEAPFTDPAIYGTSPTSFGVAILLAKPDGEILRETFSLETTVVREFLRAGLRGHPGLAGPPPRASLPGESRAERALAEASWMIACGEWEEADLLLEACAQSGGAPRLPLVRADLLRLRRDFQGALDALAAAPADASLQADVAEAQSWLHTMLGNLPAAQAALVRAGTATPARRSLAASLMLARGARTEGLAALRALALEDPPTRWSWQAAAVVSNPTLAMQERWNLQPPTAEQIAEALPLAPGPVQPGEAARAHADAVQWLLVNQRADGSWAHPHEIGASAGDDPPLVGLGATALAGIALAREARATDRGASGTAAQRAQALRAAAGRTLDYLSNHAATMRARTVQRPEVLMDYTVWSQPYALLLAAECLPDKIGAAQPARTMAADAVAMLTRKQKTGGGWSYYLSGTVAGSAQPLEVSMSFTTAAVLTALLRAPEAGVEIAPELIAEAVRCLEDMRLENGAFRYMVEHTSKTPVGGTPGDAAGRGPACALTLHRAGRADADAVRARLQLFVEHLPQLAREQGKVMMHCGPEAQGSHYLMFDYMYAAEAVAALPPAERAAFRKPLLEAILAARQADGSFVDNPQIGRSAGTAMAVIALLALEVESKP